MPRKPRIQATDTPYHITQRGVDKQAIVVDDDDRRTLVRIFGQTVIEYRWSLRAFCLLDNHLHALVVTRDANVSVGMKLFQQTYVRHFNDRHGRVGPLFQGRFGAQVLERDEHHLATLRYIPLNPVTHGACDRPEDWRWSSFRHYASGIEGVIEIDSQWTAQKRERMGVRPKVRLGPVQSFPP